MISVIQGSADAGGSAGQGNITMSGILALAAGDVVDARIVSSDAGGVTAVVVDGQFTIERLSD